MNPLRNPIFIPNADIAKRACNNCGADKWTGRSIQGAVTFTCSMCHFKWYGGLPQLPQDPTIPRAPEINEPVIQFVENLKLEGGIEEIRRKPDHRTDFRKGALVPNEDEEW